MADDYSDFQDEKPSNEAFAALHAAVASARQKQREIAALTEQLEAHTAHLNGILYGSLPTMMMEMKLQKFTTEDGLDINLKEEVSAHISEANKPEAFRWLNDNQHGGIIKRVISVAFAKGQEDRANALLDLISPEFPDVEDAKAVHPSTLKAWVNEMLKKGEPFPLDKFGVRQIKVAKFPTKKT